jgi:CheY-like chemotaxis protein
MNKALKLFPKKDSLNLDNNQDYSEYPGLEAIQACRSYPDIDLILMDIKMPYMDGYEATRIIREFNKDVIIIAQTAFVLPGDIQKTIDAGCNDYIAKPVIYLK